MQSLYCSTFSSHHDHSFSFVIHPQMFLVQDMYALGTSFPLPDMQQDLLYPTVWPVLNASNQPVGVVATWSRLMNSTDLMNDVNIPAQGGSCGFWWVLVSGFWLVGFGGFWLMGFGRFG